MNNVNSKHFNSKPLMFVLLGIALIQMPQGAIMPAIEHITRYVFPERSLQQIQTAMAMINLLSVAAGVGGAMLIKFGFASKKFVTIFGIFCMTAAGVSAILLNMMGVQFWHLFVMNILIGLGMGFCVPNSQSIMFDNFDADKRQFLSGMTAAFLSAGGVIMSIAGGILVTVVWFGGYLMTLFTIPVIIIALLFVPADKKLSSKQSKDGTTKLPLRILYYGALIFLFSALFNVSGLNISTHIAAGNIGDAAVAGAANAMPMLGGIVMGLLFVKVSVLIGDHILPLAFMMLFIGFSLLNLFPYSLAVTLGAMFIMGLGLSMLMPRTLFNVSNITNPGNSATATMIILSIAPGGGGFLSPIVMTNLTYALGGDSTRFRFQFTAFVCLAIAIIALLINRHHKKVDAAKGIR